MKKFTFAFLILLPCLTFGQLPPKIPDFMGNVKQVTEKRYGKESDLFGIFKKKYYPGLFSGWEKIYQFNHDSKLIRLTSTYNGKINVEYVYQYDTIGNKRIEREITSENSIENKGDYTESEYIIGSNGIVDQVNFRTFNSKECSTETFLIEKDAKYINGKLVSYNRQNIGASGDVVNTEICSLFYNALGQLIRLERKNIDIGLTTILYYTYNQLGLLDHYSIDYLADLTEYGQKNEMQNIFFKYDRQGNWIKMFWKSGNKNRLEVKRQVKYW